MKRSAIKIPKHRKCALRSCRTRFVVTNPWHRLCSDACIREFARLQGEKARKRFARAQERKRLADKRETRAKLEALKTLPQLHAEAQPEFNAFIRERDFDLPCISCGEPNPPITSGGQWDAGHFRTVGAAAHLRYNEDNAHKQCKHCNGGRGDWKFSARRTVSEEYRERLVERIGLARVEALENDNRTHKWTRDELRVIRDTYRVKARELRKERTRKAA